MRIAIAGLCALLFGCASAGDDVTQLCEIELSIVGFPRLIQASQSVDDDGVSNFMCTLSTRDPSLGESDLRPLVEQECRRFMQEAMSAATKCSGVRFSPRAGLVKLEEVQGTDINGPYFALRGSARRSYPN